MPRISLKHFHSTTTLRSWKQNNVPLCLGKNKTEKGTIARVNLQNRVGLTLSVACVYFPETLNLNTKNKSSAERTSRSFFRFS